MEKHGESQTRHALLSGAARSPPGPPSPTPQDTRDDIVVTQIVQGTPPVSESATVRLHSTSTLIFLCHVDDHALCVSSSVSLIMSLINEQTSLFL